MTFNVFLYRICIPVTYRDYLPVCRSQVCLYGLRQVQVHACTCIFFFLTQTAAAPVPVWKNICAAFWVCLKRLHGLSTSLLFHQSGLNLLLASVCRLEILGQASEPPPVTHQHDFHWHPRAGGAPSGKKKHGGRGSASIQTLLIGLSVSMEPQPQQYCWHGLRHVFDMTLCVQDKAVCEECVQCSVGSFVIGKCLVSKALVLYWTWMVKLSLQSPFFILLNYVFILLFFFTLCH